LTTTANPKSARQQARDTGDFALRVENLSVYYETPRGTVKAVDEVSFTLKQGERFALVGESGSGKSTLAMGLMRLTRPPGHIAGGKAILNGRDLVGLDDEEMRQVRLSEMALVPQGAMNSLNPVMRVGQQIADGIIDHTPEGEEKPTKQAMRARIVELLNRVGLRPMVANLFPHELSGGMKQRVAMAIGISLNPSVIIADEPTSALDVIVQRQIMQTLGRLQEGLNAAVLLVGHDMGLVAQFADTIGVMYAGKLVEVAPVRTMFTKPLHAYPRMLIDSLPTMDVKKRLVGIPGMQPSLLNLPPGDPFAPRSPLTFKPEDAQVQPKLVEVEPGHWVALSRSSVEDFDKYAHLVDY
jgi:peptide/nickel transport system ATP-binding protein